MNLTIRFNLDGRVTVEVAEGDYQQARDAIAKVRAVLGNVPITFQGEPEAHRHDELHAHAHTHANVPS